MNHVTIGDGCSIQGSIICSNVQLQERAVLRDCQVHSLCRPVSVSCVALYNCVRLDSGGSRFRSHRWQ